MSVLQRLVFVVFSCISGVANAETTAGLTSDAEKTHLIGEQIHSVAIMQKAVCLLLLGADRALQEGAATQAAFSIDDGMKILVAAGASRTSDEANTTKPLMELTSSVTISARQIVAGDLHTVPMRLMLVGARELQAELVRIRREHSDSQAASQVEALQARTQHFVHDQASGLQELLRDACFMQVGLLNEERISLFRDRIESYEQAYQTLLAGDEAQGILPPPDVSARVTLEKTQKFWQRIRPTLEASAKGEAVDLSVMQKASIFGQLVEKSITKLLGYYTPS